MKKYLCGLLALVLTAAMAVGCTQESREEPPAPSGIFYDITGLDPRSTACTVGDITFPTETYLYWVAYACSSMEYNLNMYHSLYGLYEEMFDEEGKLLWDVDFMDGKSLSEQAAEQAKSNVLFYASIEGKAKELGLELNEEDRTELNDNLAGTMEQMGGEEAFQENLDLMGISRESFDRISEDGLLFQKLLDLVMEEGSALYMAPEDYEQYASYTDHILLSTTDQETNEPYSDEVAAEKYATAQDLLSQLQNAGDGEVETLFDSLAAEYSEDPGRAASKGYVVTEDTNFVPEFLDTALALEPGQLSDIVESTYGYHILYRRALAPMLKENPDQLSALAEEHLYDLLDSEAETLTVENSEEINALNIAEFYTSYSAKMEEISAAKEAESSDNTDTGDSGDTSGTGNSSDTGDNASGTAGAAGTGSDATPPADGAGE